MKLIALHTVQTKEQRHPRGPFTDHKYLPGSVLETDEAEAQRLIRLGAAVEYSREAVAELEEIAAAYGAAPRHTARPASAPEAAR